MITRTRTLKVNKPRVEWTFQPLNHTAEDSGGGGGGEGVTKHKRGLFLQLNLSSLSANITRFKGKNKRFTESLNIHENEIEYSEQSYIIIVMWYEILC